MAKRTHNSDELFELKWNNYSQSITEEIYNIRQNDCLVDLTFCCEGVTIGCHKLLIFACSPVLREILTQNPSPHPIIYITDIKLPILQALLKYVYQGEVQISKSDLVSFMKAADSFQIRGLQSKKSLAAEASNAQSPLDAKKRRTYEAGPSSASLVVGDPLTSTSIVHHQEHDASNLDFSEFENECSFGTNDESVDDTKFSQTGLVQQAAQKLRKFIKSMPQGVEVMNEYEQHGALTDEKREDLSQLVTEFMAKGVVKGGKAGNEAIAEATLMLFPGAFEDNPKSLAETLNNRLGRQQRYGAESPERPLLELKRRRMRPNLKQIEHDLMIFVARSLANIPSKHQDTSKSFIFNPFHKDLSVHVELDGDCCLKTQALCPVCKEMIDVESVAKRQSHGMKYRFKSLNYVNHVKNHLK